MKKDFVIRLILILCFVASQQLWAVEVQLVEEDANGITLRLEIPNFQFNSPSIDGKGMKGGEDFQTITFDGCSYTSETGKPHLPFIATLLGIPPDAQFSTQILSAEHSVRSVRRIYPVPATALKKDARGYEYPAEAFYLNEEFYAQNSFYPQKIVRLGFTGYIRSQRVVSMQFNPVQYNPTSGTVKLYNRIVARLLFRNYHKSPARTSLRARTESKFYESMFKESILNYDSARNWRAIPNFAAPSIKTETPIPLPVSSPVYKILVNEDGMYHITYVHLKEEEVEVDEIDPRTFKLFLKGKQIPIFARGENDGTFDEGDEIVFYGQKLRGTKTYHDFFTDDNVYWLMWNSAPGLRMVKKSAGFLAKDARRQRKFRSLKHIEQDDAFIRLPFVTESDEGEYDWYGGRGRVLIRQAGVYVLPPLPNDSLFWSVITAPNYKEYSLELPGVAETSLPAKVKVMLHGQTDNIAKLDHHVQIWLNEEIMLGDIKWDGQKEYLLANDEVPQSFLKDGKNILRIVSPGDTEAGDFDQILFNWVEIEYWREYVAEYDYLEFSVPPTEEEQHFSLTISSFSQPNVEIYGLDGSLYHDNQVMEDEEKPGTYEVRFLGTQPGSNIDNLDSAVQYIAITPDKLKSPKKMILDEPSNLRATTNSADYIIITHSTLALGVEPLAQLRRERGLRVAIVKIDDIYDEFNYGIFNPYAIKDFLRYVVSFWQPPAPTYLLLAGDATVKYQRANINSIPSILVQTPEYGAAASDNQLVAFSGEDAFPDMIVGRLPARNLIELNSMVEKIVAYERSPEFGPWRSKLLFLAGVGDKFTWQSEMLIKEYTQPAFNFARIYTTDQKSPYYGGAQEVIDNLNSGSLLVNFLGHGGGSIWSDNRMLGLEDVPLLKNKKRLPFIFSLTCFTGYFDNPHGSSLGEELVRAEDGGAIAFFGSTGLGLLNGDYWLAIELFNSMFKTNNIVPGETFRLSNPPSLGQITTSGKIKFYTQYSGYVDLVEIFTLIADPATTLAFPKLNIPLNVTLSLDRNETLKISGTIPGEPFNGSAVVIVAAPDEGGEVIAEESIEVTANRFETYVAMPSEAKSGIGTVRAYVWNDQIDGLGYATYTVAGPHITDIKIDPEIVPPNVSPHVLVFAKSKGKIESVTCFWSFNNRDWIPIKMEPFQGDVYKTVSPLPGRESGHVVFYYVEAIDSLNRKSRCPTQICRIARYPDLSVSQEDVHWKPPILEATVKNIGELDAQKVVVKFFDGKPENGMLIGADKIIPLLKAGESAKVQVEWQPKENQNTIFVVVALTTSDSPDSPIIEHNEHNNTANKDISRDKFSLTPALGSNGPIKSIDGNLIFVVPSGGISKNSVLTLEQKEDILIVEQPDISYTALPNKPTGLVYLLNISTGLPSSDATFSGELSIKFDREKSPDVDSLAVYRQDEGTQKWIYVGGKQSGDKIAVKIEKPGAYALMEHHDKTPPSIKITVEHQAFIENSYVSQRPVIASRITDKNGIDLNKDRITVLLDGVAVETSEYTVLISPMEFNTALLSYAPSLSTGKHRVTVQAFDANNNNAAESISFQVAGELEIKNIANFPNPFEPGTKITKGTTFIYILTDNADKITLKIYTVTGRLVRAIEELDGFADYNEYHWNGCDEDGEELPNGVYFYKLIVEKDKKVENKTGRLAILR